MTNILTNFILFSNNISNKFYNILCYIFHKKSSFLLSSLSCPMPYVAVSYTSFESNITQFPVLPRLFMLGAIELVPQNKISFK